MKVKSKDWYKVKIWHVVEKNYNAASIFCRVLERLYAAFHEVQSNIVDLYTGHAENLVIGFMENQ